MHTIACTVNWCTGLLKDSTGSLVSEQVLKILCVNVTYLGELGVSKGGFRERKRSPIILVTLIAHYTS